MLDTTSLSEEHKICFALEVGAKHLKFYTPGCYAPSGGFLLIFCDTSYTLLSNKHGLKKNTEGNDQLPPYGEEEASAYTIMLSWKPFKHQVSESSLSSL